MKQVKKTAEYTIFLRNDTRYAVRKAGGVWVNGEDKVAILRKEELLKAPAPKVEEPGVQEPAAAEEVAAEATEEKAAE
ncbi:MAG: hypothetical protein ACI9Y1_002071 [Lentisphaeria bacterium]|jgi:hypothetical protein